MRKHPIYTLLFLLLIAACNSNTATTANTTDTPATKTVIAQPVTRPLTPSATPAYDTAYTPSKTHNPFMVTGMFNNDATPDTAMLIRHKATGKDALFIKHGGTAESFLLKKGSDAGTDFDDFNWVQIFEVTPKGTRIWENVIDGEIVGEEQVPDSMKVTLSTDAIFVHVDEACGGGYLYFRDGKYTWVQQD